MSTPNDEQPTRPLPPVDGGTDEPTRVMDASAGVVPPNEPPYGPPTDEFPEGGGGGNRKFLFVMLAVVAAIAIAGILVLVLGGGDDDETTTAASTATEETVETVEEETTTEESGGGGGNNNGGDETGPPDADNPALFKLGESDINCMMEEMAVSCDIPDFTYSPPPKPDDCPGDWGGRISLGLQGPADFVCYSDALPSTGTDVVLDHGQSSTVGDFTCTSDGDAVYCQNNKTGYMFTVAEGAYQFLDGPG